MTPERRLRFWLIGLVVFGFLLWLLSGVLTPFVLGAAVAYFLDPVADRLEKWGVARWLAAAMILVTFFVAMISLVLLLVPVLQAQISEFSTRAPGYVSTLRAYLEPLIERLQAQLTPDMLKRLKEAAGAYSGQAIDWIGRVLAGLWQGGAAVFDLLALALITPLVAFYLLRDWDRLIERVDDLLPRDGAETIREQARAIDAIIAGFVRGQATVCFLLGAFYGIGLTLAGLDFGLLIGFGTGLISFIPFFGMLVGLVAGLGMAIAQFDGWVPVAIVAGIFAAGQIIEGNFLTPNLVGDRVGLHPVWVIFALLASGALFGFTGVLLAVPVAAVIGVLVRFGIGRYRNSHYYSTPPDG